MKLIYLPALLVMAALTQSSAQKKVACTDECCKKTVTVNKVTLKCKLTTPELRERKNTVIASLQKQVQEKKELVNGYAYRFSGADVTIDELADFIKTERECCDFFTFNLSVKGDKTVAWLHITGPKGSKEFIKRNWNFDANGQINSVLCFFRVL